MLMIHHQCSDRTSAITDVATKKPTIRKRPIRDFGGSLCSLLFRIVGNMNTIPDRIVTRMSDISNQVGSNRHLSLRSPLARHNLLSPPVVFLLERS